jgi:hypothetical protein
MHYWDTVAWTIIDSTCEEASYRLMDQPLVTLVLDRVSPHLTSLMVANRIMLDQLKSDF